MTTRTESFNQNRTTIHMEWSVPNNAWFVWRDDSGYVARNQLTIHEHKSEAVRDFDSRCSFLRSIQD